MSLNESPPAAPLEHDDHGILCARCEHLNRQGQKTCEVCGADLFMECPRCGHVNQQFMTRCRNCRKRLRRRLFHRRHHRRHRRHSHSRSLARRIGMVLLQVALVLLGLLTAFGLLYLFNYFRVRI